jgi:hypothetical protein
MIMYEATVNKDGKLGPMSLERMLDAKEHVDEVDQLINKARTFGIPVKNHGHGDSFKK